MIKILNNLGEQQMAPMGGKAGTLTHLRQNGFPVPNGVVVLLIGDKRHHIDETVC